MPLIVVAAILSLSLVVNLPGLAVSPMLGTLKQVFPHSTQLEEQLLTMLPNLLIIPCLLLGGRISLSNHKISVITCALLIYAVSGIAYLFAESMTALIIISCALGVGAGLLIPFSTGLIADVFTGQYRMRQMGYQSAISNMTLVVATFVVGWLSKGKNWHMPFLVYLIPLLPLAMTFFLKRIPKADLNDSATSGATQQQKPTTTAVTAPQGVKTHDGLIMSRMWACIGLYFFVTFCVIILSYYAPYVAEKEHLSSEFTGTITSVFFLFVFLPGFFLSKIIDVLKNSTMIVCIALIFIGLGIFAAWPTATGMMIGAVLMGLGYGTSQPMIYDKATFTTTDPRKATLVLSFILAGNYLAIVVAPVVIDFVRGLFHAENVRAFSFIFNCALSGLFLIFAIIKRKSFIFRS